MINRRKSVSTRNNIATRSSAFARKSAGAISGTALAVGLSLITAQAAQAEMATLTVLDIKAVSVSEGTDGATTALFASLGAAATAAAAVATLGASVPVTAGLLAGAAASGAGSGAGAGEILGDTFQGADDLYFTIDGAAVWPPEDYSRTIDTGETEQVNMTFEFDNQVGVTLGLWERDTASANDSMGEQQFRRMQLPYQDQVVIADTDEGSMYLVRVLITARIRIVRISIPNRTAAGRM